MFHINEYDHKLHIFNEACRNQLRAEMLSVEMLSEVQGELAKVEDLLRPWL